MKWELASQIATTFGAIVGGLTVISAFALYRIRRRDDAAKSLKEVVAAAVARVQRLSVAITKNIVAHEVTKAICGREVLPMRHGVYGSPDYVEKLNEKVKVVLFRGDPEQPEWVQQHFPGAEIAMRVDDVGTMAPAVANHMGLARMPCYVGDTEHAIRRLDLKITPSTWGIWILSHVDLRSTARVRVAREFLIDVIEKQRDLVLGERSRYFETA